MEKRLIAITGIDGSGKTTLIKGLLAHLSDVKVVSIWDTLKNQEANLTNFISNKESIDQYLKSLDPTSRALFMLHPLYQSLQNALNGNENLILIDSYWYKYIAGQLVYNMKSAHALPLASLFPHCEHTFFIKANPANIVGRKNIISGYEAGFNTKSNNDGYIEFQNKLQLQIEKTLLGHSHSILNGEDELESNIRIILDYLQGDLIKDPRNYQMERTTFA